ncbi:MAG: HD domain-containing protein [Bacteroidales bacterium]|nr:HD domain-containing protein [Candidatus Cacconaster merdequi]
MGNKFLNTDLFDKAMAFAIAAHHNTERRGKGFPYIIHPMEAVAIVSTLTSDQELLAAAALHDTVEDTDVTIGQIKEEFGEKIASLVASESDSVFEGLDESASWRQRKQAAIDRIAASSYEAKIVAMGDKLSNLRAIYNDYIVIGDKLWDRFHAPGGRDDHEWHYRGLASSLSDLRGTAAFSEFTSLLDKVFGGPRPELIDMADYKESGDGFTATSYSHKDGERMIKLYEPFIPSTEPKRELHVSQVLTRMGINIPKAYRMVTDGKRIGLEFERIKEKKSFARAISQAPEKMEQYVVDFAHMCLDLHKTECDTTVFAPAKERFLKAVAVSEDFDIDQKARITSFISSIPDTTTCLHGDMHIGNAIMAPSGKYWIDLSDFGYGNPLFDLGMFCFVSRGFGGEELMDKLFHISMAQMDQVWNIFLNEYFKDDPDKEAKAGMVMKIAALYAVFFMNRHTVYPGMREYVDEYLLNTITI